MTSQRLISTSSEWSFDLLERYDRQIARVAGEYSLETYPNQLEVISAEQMMDAYASAGLPVGYQHWSFGKHFLDVERRYRRGQMGLAYEIVINSNPCIAYLMEENTMTMQPLVIAHAAYGHNSFFKGNHLFRTWTNADAIIDYLVFARDYIRDCEQRHGELEVERVLDSCHAIMDYGVDLYKRPAKLSATRELERQKERETYRQRQVNEIWQTLPVKEAAAQVSKEECFPAEAEENVLYFIEKHAPMLESWQRELVRIVRKLAQYFYPQRQTKVMNEGWACFWHYEILNRLYAQGYLSDGFMLEFLQSHTNVVYQPDFDQPGFSGINPYTLGFSMMSDIRRICEQPTDEDREWFPDIAGGNWQTVLDFAMRNFKDESFISQYLSPKLIRELHLFSVVDDDASPELEVSAIHDEHGYRYLRQLLAEQHNLGLQQPCVQVQRIDRRGDRSLTLSHTRHQRRPLSDDADEVLRHIASLWGFTVRLEELDANQKILNTRECPAVKEVA